MPCGQVRPHRLHGLGCLAVFQANAGQRAKAVRLNEYLAFLAFLRADLGSKVVVCAQKPIPVPAMLVYHRQHLFSLADVSSRLGFQSAVLRNRRQFAPRMHKQPGDEHRLGHFAIFIGGGLKALARSVREAVQVQAVVPVGAANERKAVGAQPIQCIREAALQVVVERRLRTRLVVELDRLVKNAPVAGLFQVG